MDRLKFLENLLGRREPSFAPEPAPPNLAEWQMVTLMIPLGDDRDPEDETDPWLEFGDELGGTVSDKGLGNLTLTTRTAWTI